MNIEFESKLGRSSTTHPTFILNRIEYHYSSLEVPRGGYDCMIKSIDSDKWKLIQPWMIKFRLGANGIYVEWMNIADV